MAEPRKSGLGGGGFGRIRENLGQPQAAPEADRAIYGDKPPASRPLATPWYYPDSSRVQAYSYDYGTQELHVKFLKYGTPWVYEGVNTAIFEAFDASPSKGKFINSTLNYTKYHQASAAEAATWPV